MIPKAIRRKKGAKRTTAADVERIVRYVCGKAVAVDLWNLAGDWQDAPMQMWAVANGNTRTKSLMYHMVLSWPETECPTDAQAIQAGRAAIAELGTADHQAVIAVHRDRTCVHVHVALNRICSLTFAAMSTSNDFAKLERACRKIEATQGWSADRGRFDVVVTETPDGPDVSLTPKPQSHWEAKQDARRMKRGSSASDMHAERRTRVASLAEALSDPWKMRIRAAMDQGSDWAEIHTALGEIGMAYAKFGSGARMVLSGSDAHMKPSDMGQAYAMKAMQARLGPWVAPETVAQDEVADDRPVQAVMGPHASKASRLQTRAQNADPTTENAVMLDEGAEAAPLTKSDTFKRTLLQRSYVGITLRDDVVRAIRRVTLDAEPPEITLRDGGAVRDEGTRVTGTLAGDDLTKARLMIALATAKGWDRCKITGTEAFRQIAADVAREAGLVVTNPLQDEAKTRARSQQTAPSQIPPTSDLPSEPMPDDINIDDLRRATRVAAVENRRRQQELALYQRQETVKLRDLLDGSRTLVARALRQGLRLHHADQRLALKQALIRTPVIPTVPLSGLNRQIRAAHRWLRDGTSLVKNGHWSQPLLPDHTTCRQMWVALALQDRVETGECEADAPADLPHAHLRNTRVTAGGEVLFAHRDAADNIVGFEVGFDGNAESSGTGFAEGGQRTVWTMGERATATRAVVLRDASAALQMAQAEARDDTLYISVGGKIGAHARDMLADLLTDKEVIVGSAATADEAFMRDLHSIAPGGLSIASTMAEQHQPETQADQPRDDAKVENTPDADHSM